MSTRFFSIRSKVFLLIGYFMIGLISLIALIAYFDSTHHEIENRYQALLEQRDRTDTIRDLIEKMQGDLLRAVYQDEVRTHSLILADNEDLLTEFETLYMNSLQRGFDEDYYFLKENEMVLMRLRASVYKTIVLLQGGNREQAAQFLVQHVEPDVFHMKTFVEEANELRELKIADHLEIERTHVARQQWLKYGGPLVVLIGSCVAGFLMARNIVKPIESLTRQINALKNSGTGRANLVSAANDETAVLAHAFNELIKFGEDNREMLEEQKQHVEDLLDSTAEAIYGLDLQGCCTFANPACVRMLGLRDAAELVGRNMHDQIHHQRPDGAACTVEECSIFGTLLSGNRNHSDKEMLWRADGSCFPAEYWSYPVHRDGKLAGAVITFLDITERQQQDAQILEQAHFDTLTKLPNRFLALDRMSQMLNDARRNDTQAAVLFLDLDDFKKVNDSLGHDAGDKLLYEAASRLRSRLRLGDTIGRLGGDEFIVLLGGVTDSADVRAVAEDLLKYFWEPFSVDARDLLLTASIGIALFPEDGDTPSELLRNADSAMYHAKEQGRNTYSFFTDAMNRGVSRRLALEEQMHGALGRGEFRLCYQPQIELGSGRIVGVEALLRWHNPALGEISPVEFIPIAEQTGLIMPVGEFVLTEALSMAATWQQEQGQPLRIAVNLSPRQFRDPNLVGFIEQAIHRSGVSANTLELEITEGLLMSGYANIEEDLGALNDLGVGIAMDDFGTGYSSLGYLRNYPFDTMKIDRTFVNEVTANVADMELVRAATAMAHGLGLKVVAEGVETEEQRALLASLGCDFAQGYLFSKPVSPEEISAMLKDRYREQNPPEIRRLIS